MSAIAKRFRAATAAAQLRASMEAADPTVQGQDGGQDELTKIQEEAEQALSGGESTEGGEGGSKAFEAGAAGAKAAADKAGGGEAAPAEGDASAEGGEAADASGEGDPADDLPAMPEVDGEGDASTDAAPAGDLGGELGSTDAAPAEGDAGAAPTTDGLDAPPAEPAAPAEPAPEEIQTPAELTAEEGVQSAEVSADASEAAAAEETAAAVETGDAEGVEAAAADAGDTTTTEEPAGDTETSTDAPAEGDPADDLPSLDEPSGEVTESAPDASTAVEPADTTDPTPEPAAIDTTETPPATATPVEDAIAADTGAPAEAAPAAPAAAPATPAAPAAQPAAEAAPEQKEAAAPSTRTETSEAVMEIVEVAEVAASAQSAEEVVKQARGVTDDLSDLGELAGEVNKGEGVSLEAFALLSHGLERIARELQVPVPDLGVSMEDYKRPGQRLKLSLESIHELIKELDGVQPHLERQAIEALDRLSEAQCTALFSTRDRLLAVISQANASSDDREGGSVDVSDGISGALAIEGAIPADLASSIMLYVKLGQSILGEYSTAAFRAATNASLINNAVDFSSVEAFWEKVGAKVDDINDPRAILSERQLAMVLPGGVALFGDSRPTSEASNPVLRKLFDYNTSNAPLETAAASKDGTNSADGTYPALSASKISAIGSALLDVLDLEQIVARLEQGSKLWPEAQDSIRHLRETLSNAPQDIDQTAGVDFSQLVKFVEVNYSLATWPLLNYLNNVITTVNAFVLLAERSLVAEPAPETPAVPETPATPEIPDAAPVAEPTPPTEVPAAEPAAEPAAPAEGGDLDNLPEPPKADEPAV